MVGSFALAEGGSYLPTGPSMNAAKDVVHLCQAGGAKQVIALKVLQVLDGPFKPGIQLRNGMVDMGLDRRYRGGFVVGAAAHVSGLWLRQVGGAFTFVCSHIACLHAGGVVRARSVLVTPDVAR